MLKTVVEHKGTPKELTYEALVFICPGCASTGIGKGLHMLPVNAAVKKPSWDWDGDLENPTLAPSILTDKGGEHQCHSFLQNGKFTFLQDSTHELSGQNQVPMPDLPDWVIDD
jgi:hypothetical protein